MVLTQPISAFSNGKGARRFHTTMVLTQPYQNSTVQTRTKCVSIPLWFLRNPGGQQAARKRRRVSIPLWFLRNFEDEWGKRVFEVFPYHYGSYATRNQYEKVMSTQLTFPYHYGSYATGR